MQGIVKGLYNFFGGVVHESFKQIDNIYEIGVEKLIKSLQAQSETHVFSDGSTHWKRSLEKMISKDFLSGKIKNEETFEQRFYRYAYFVDQCASNFVPLSQEEAAVLICKKTKELSDRSFYLFALVFFVFPLTKTKEEGVRLGIFNRIAAILPEIEEKWLPTLLLGIKNQLQDLTEKEWWNEKIKTPLIKEHGNLFEAVKNERKKIQNKLFDEYLASKKTSKSMPENQCDTKADKNSSSAYKIAFIAIFFIFPNAAHALTPFNGTTFWNAVNQWNPKDGYFNVTKQLIAQEWCQPGILCLAPNNLIPNTTNILNNFCWNKIEVVLKPSSPINFNNNIFCDSLFNLTGNFSFNNSILTSTHIGGNVSYAEIMNSNFQEVYFDGAWKGSINNTILQETFIGNHSIQFNITNSPRVLLQLSNKSTLQDTQFVNITSLGLVRIPNQNPSQISYSLVKCLFQNIEKLSLDLSMTGMTSPILKNITLMKGTWVNGRIGSLKPACNRTNSVIKATNVFVNHFNFDNVLGLCLSDITAELAKEYFKRSGMTLGNNVTFTGYADSPSLDGKQIAIVMVLLTLFSAGGVGITLLLYRDKLCRRKNYHSIQDRNVEETTTAYETN